MAIASANCKHICYRKTSKHIYLCLLGLQHPLPPMGRTKVSIKAYEMYTSSHRPDNVTLWETNGLICSYEMRQRCWRKYFWRYDCNMHVIQSIQISLRCLWPCLYHMFSAEAWTSQSNSKSKDYLNFVFGSLSKYYSRWIVKQWSETNRAMNAFVPRCFDECTKSTVGMAKFLFECFDKSTVNIAFLLL